MPESIELLLARVLFVSGFAILGLVLARVARIDTSIACVAAGVVAGFTLPHLMFDTGIRAHNLQDLVFLLILPILVFEAAWFLDPRLLRQWLLPSLLLALPGVVITTCVGGLLIYLGMGHPAGFPWVAAFLAGAIISATDSGLALRRLPSASSRQGLSVLMESEGLFNDAAAVMLFGIILALAQQQLVPDGGHLAWMFLWTFAGGCLVGLVGGALTSGVIVLLGGGHSASAVLPVAALGWFYVAQHWLGVSGIIAVTLAALYSRHLLRNREEDLLISQDSMTWLGMLLNAILFTLMGLVITFDMFTERWLAISIAIGAGLVARFAGVFVSAGMARAAGHSIGWHWQVMLGWGGARGAVAIALVLALPTSLPYWWTIQAMVFGVVLFGLLVQGPCTSTLTRRLRLAEREH